MAESKVNDMGLAEFGRKELTLAEHEMPGLMAARAEFGKDQPVKGLNINGSLHMTIQTGVLIETLAAALIILSLHAGRAGQACGQACARNKTASNSFVLSCIFFL